MGLGRPEQPPCLVYPKAVQEANPTGNSQPRWGWVSVLSSVTMATPLPVSTALRAGETRSGDVNSIGPADGPDWSTDRSQSLANAPSSVQPVARAPAKSKTSILPPVGLVDSQRAASVDGRGDEDGSQCVETGERVAGVDSPWKTDIPA